MTCTEFAYVAMVTIFAIIIPLGQSVMALISGMSSYSSTEGEEESCPLSVKNTISMWLITEGSVRLGLIALSFILPVCEGIACGYNQYTSDNKRCRSMISMGVIFCIWLLVWPLVAFSMIFPKISTACMSTEKGVIMAVCCTTNIILFGVILAFAIYTRSRRSNGHISVGEDNNNEVIDVVPDFGISTTEIEQQDLKQQQRQRATIDSTIINNGDCFYEVDIIN